MANIAVFIEHHRFARRSAPSNNDCTLRVITFLHADMLDFLFPMIPCYEVTVVKGKFRKSCFSCILKPVTFGFFLTAPGKSSDLTVPGMWPLCYSWIGYQQANGSAVSPAI